MASCIAKLRSVPLSVANQVVQCFALRSALACASPIGGMDAFTSPVPATANATTTATEGGMPPAAAGVTESCESGDEQNGPNCIHYKKAGAGPKSGVVLHAYRVKSGKRSEVWFGGYKLLESTPDKLRYQFFLCGSMHVVDDDNDPGCIDEPREVVWLGDHYDSPPRTTPPSIAPVPPAASSEQGPCLVWAGNRGPTAIRPPSWPNARCIVFATEGKLIETEMARANALCASIAACQTACTAADQAACWRLGYKYWDGDGVPKNYAKGGALIRAACAANNKVACSSVALLRDQADNCADMASCTELCNREIFKACSKVASEYLKGGRIPKNPARAQELYKKACDGGDGAGCNDLGMMNWNGNGIPQGRAAAQRYLKKSCDAGFDLGCQSLIGVVCVNEAKAQTQRRPGQDAKCEVAKRSPQNLAADSRKHYSAYERPPAGGYTILHETAPTSQFCFNAMRMEECFQLNLLAQGTAIYCCP